MLAFTMSPNRKHVHSVLLTASLVPLTMAALATASAAPPGWREISPPTAVGAQAPRLATSTAGPLLTWLEPAAEGKTALRLARLEGSAWRALQPVATAADLLINWADTPVVAEGGDGALYAAWLADIGRGYGVRMARSADAGSSWRELGWLHADRSEAEHGFVSLLPESRGVRAVWLDGKTAEQEGGAMTLRTAAVGAAVADEREIDGRVCDCCSTGAAIARSGPLVVYRDRSAEEIRDIAVARLGADAPAPSAVAADGWKILGCPVNGPEIAARGTRAAVAWFTAAGGEARVQIAFSKDGGATFGAPARVDGGKPLGRVGLVLDGDDAIVSWLEHTSEAAEIRLRRILADGRIGEAITVATVPAARASGVPRILVDGARLVVAWTDPGPGGKGGRVLAGAVPLTSVPK